MRKLICSSVLWLLITPYILLAQKSFVISGEIDKRMDNKVIRMNQILPSYSSLKPSPNLKATVKNGKFSFETSSIGFELYGFQIDHNGKTYSQMIGALPQNIKVNFLDTLLKTYHVLDNGLQNQFKTALTELESVENDTSLIVNSMEKYIQTPFSTTLLFFFSTKIPERQIVRLDSLTPVIYKQNSWSHDLKILENKFLIGKYAQDFVQSNPDGVNIKLSDFRGKYVLLDFWASWCVPCREENPNLIKAYEAFNKKGFEILSVSLDEKKENWIEAIKNDKLIWQHVSDLKGWDNSVSKDIFKIHEIPQNYLIDPNGKIIAKNLIGRELYDFLMRLL